tara:strand:- start:1265 stop:3043 length:1779 start_codon:yes stop_codon:yes gene_type:complete
MAALNGIVSWGIVPLDTDNSSSLASMSWDYRSNYLKSANDQLRYQVQWFFSNINEGVESGNYRNVVNVIFKIETSVNGVDWNTIGNVKKSRDIANRKYDNGSQPNGHRFTVDISQLVSGELSYGLCPINKGTWQSNYYGGMNGGLTMQDNVIGSNSATGTPISEYNVSKNGTFRRVRVSATFEILDTDKQLITASDFLSYAPYLTVINSVNQFERDSVYYNKYTVDFYTGYEFLTRCPNSSSGSTNEDFKKPVRIDEQAEWLQFYIRRGHSDSISSGSGASADQVCAMGIKINTYIGDSLENTFYLNDFQQNLLTETFSGFAVVGDSQEQMFIQNISPYYINNTAALKEPQSTPARSTTDIADNWDTYTGSKITANTTRYTANLVKVSLYSPYTNLEVSNSYNYTIDRESENIPYGFVRFHWLNSVGGTDSYTAKRDVVEGLTISRDVIERKSGDRTWYQANSGAVNSAEVNVSPNSSYISDTMRGGDLYKGGREVSNVNADRVQSVYTEPLNKSVAKWLEEMMLSPNVWIEKDTEATAKGNSSNPYLRPSTKGYIPVIITNSDIETVNQENGLVRFNIEYTLAHKVQTQRN